MNNGVDPNLAAILSVIGPLVTVVVLWIKSSIDASRASAERTAATVTQAVQLGQIHEAVNGHMTAAVAQIADLKSSVSGMLAAKGPTQQAAADAAGQKSLEG
jgi:hypothetical protein